MKTLLLSIVVVIVSSLAVSAQSMFDEVNDFDGDGKADYAVTRDENGQKIWYLLRSSAGFGALAWGSSGDTITAGDYDGDSRTDVAVTRLTSTENNLWRYTTYYLASSNESVGVVDVERFPIFGVTLVTNEDYDGDGKTDPGIYMWHGVGAVTYKKSSTGVTATVSSIDHLLRIGDVTGNSAAEVVSYTPPNSVTVKNAAEGGQFTLGFGVIGDRWVAADFDGDNKGDFAIFRPATGDWWWIRSSDLVVNAAHFGSNGDVPVPADYDGDSRSDLAVYRPSSPQSTFYVLGSTAGFSAIAFGVPTDSVVTY